MRTAFPRFPLGLGLGLGWESGGVRGGDGVGAGCGRGTEAGDWFDEASLGPGGAGDVGVVGDATVVRGPGDESDDGVVELLDLAGDLRDEAA